MINLKNSIPAGFLVATVLLGTAPAPVKAADKYLETVEQRLDSLERQLNVMRGDAKGKDILSSEIPVYVKPKSKYITDVKLRGRLQFQSGYVAPTSATGNTDNYSTFEIRRARIGIEATLMNNFKAMIEFNANGNAVNFNEGYIQYTAFDYAKPLVGLVKPRYGYEENTSSAKLWTVERSNLNNTLAVDYKTGAVVEGEYNVFNYSMGIFNQTDTSATNQSEPTAGSRNGAYIYNISAGLDLSEMVGNKLEFRIDYVNANYTPQNAANASAGVSSFTGTGDNFVFVNNIAASAAYGIGPFEMRAEFMAGKGLDGRTGTNRSNSSTLYGFYAEPSYFIIPKKFQAVLRYEYMDSSGGAQTITMPGRYAGRDGGGLTSGLGDNFQGIYGGMNYYINGDDLKLMLGVEYDRLLATRASTIGGAGPRVKEAAVTIYTAVRMQF